MEEWGGMSSAGQFINFWNVSFTISGSLLLSFVTVIVRGAIGESYASTNTSWSTGVDVSIVVMAQVALFVTYGIYFSMLMHVKQLFKEALFFMRRKWKEQSPIAPCNICA
eukprot:1156099-Pelagomonas_calceolata.AAC.6